MKWTPDFIIAIILVIGSIFLITTGIDGEMKAILTIAAGWCFGSQFQARQLNKKGITDMEEIKKLIKKEVQRKHD